MTDATRRLLSQFEALPSAEKQSFVCEVLLTSSPWDSGPLSDDVTTNAGDKLAAMHEEEEHRSKVWTPYQQQ